MQLCFASGVDVSSADIIICIISMKVVFISYQSHWTLFLFAVINSLNNSNVQEQELPALEVSSMLIFVVPSVCRRNLSCINKL